jgi:DNA-binding GntR family transcriptional regulator
VARRLTLAADGAPAPEARFPLGPSSTRTRVDVAASWLRESILSGDLVPGERIPLDRVAERLDMSLIPVREALRMIATEGLVRQLPHRGYLVQPLSVADVDDSYRLRMLIEPLAVRLAVPRLSEADFAALHTDLELLGRSFKAADWPGHRIHHRAFHFGIYEKCESAWLLRFTDMLWVNTQRYQRLTSQIKGELRERMREHERILAACEAGDAERAGGLMLDHLSRAALKIREFLEHNEQALVPPEFLADGS